MAHRPQCSRMGMTFYKETAYGSGVPTNNIDKMYEPNEPIIIELTQERIDDAETIKGHEFPLNPDLDIVVAQNISLPFSFPGTCSVLGVLSAFTLGTDVVTGTLPDFVHTHKMEDLCINDQLVSSAWILGISGAPESIYKVKGVVMNELHVSMDSPGRLTVTGTAFTDGTMTAEPSYVFPTISNAHDPLLGSQSDFLWADYNITPLVSKKAKFRSFEFSINNNLDQADGRSNTATAGKYLSSLRTGNRTIEMTITVEGHQGDEFWMEFMDEAVKDVEIIVAASATRSWSARFKRCKIASITQSFDGIRDVLEIMFKPFWVEADASPIIVVVENGDPAYLL